MFRVPEFLRLAVVLEADRKLDELDKMPVIGYLFAIQGDGEPLAIMEIVGLSSFEIASDVIEFDDTENMSFYLKARDYQFHFLGRLCDVDVLEFLGEVREYMLADAQGIEKIQCRGFVYSISFPVRYHVTSRLWIKFFEEHQD